MTAGPSRKAPIEALLARLQAHALGQIELSATQLRAIDLLLRKTEAARPGEGGGRVIHVIFERKIATSDDDDQGGG